MSVEASLLLACARRFVSGQPCDELRTALRDDLDWSRLSEIADAHSVSPLLYWALQQECPTQIPEEVRARFENHALSSLAQTAELLRVLAIFEQNRIPVISLKGPVLAASAYGDLGLRFFSDLDLLIRPDDVARARDLLIASRYTLRSDLHWPSRNALRRSKDGELIFERADGRVTLDLHWKLFPEYFPEPLKDDVWHNLVAIPLGGQSVPTLSTEDLLLFLAAHGGKHRWERLVWICDLALVLQRTTVDWEHLLLGARKAHIERMLVVGLLLARDILGAELPGDADDLLRSNSRAIKLAHEVRDRLSRDSEIEESAIKACGTNLRMLERSTDKIRFLIGILITPGEAEWSRLRLPPILYKLYYPYRLLRLLRKRSYWTECLPELSKPSRE